MKDLTNNDLIFSQLKQNYDAAKNQLVSESEEESDESEEFQFDKNKNKKETKIQRQIREKDVIDKKIKEILDNVEAKFDNIFIDVMDKKYNLDQINQFKENNNIY